MSPDAEAAAGVADTPTLHSPAWLQFVCFNGKGLNLTDRNLTSETHRIHAPSAGRYTVVLFDSEKATVSDCDVCGQPLALLEGEGECAILYSGDDAALAQAIFEGVELGLRNPHES